MTRKILFLFTINVVALSSVTSLISYACIYLMSGYMSENFDIDYYPDAISWAYVATFVLMALSVRGVGRLLGLRIIPDKGVRKTIETLFSFVFLTVGTVAALISIFISYNVDQQMEIISFSNKMGNAPMDLFIFVAMFNAIIACDAVWKLWALGKMVSK